MINDPLGGGWTNPFETYARQIGSFPQVGLEIKDVWNHQPVHYTEILDRDSFQSISYRLMNKNSTP